MTLRSGQALTTGSATLVLVTSIAKQSRANGNVSFGHSPTTNVDNPNALVATPNMKLINKIPFKRQVIILLFSCFLSICLIEFRVTYFKNKYNHFLIWNLILALVPLLLAYISFIYYYARRRKIDIILIILFFCWLLFFPNAPYIVSEFIHLKPKKGIPIWFDILLFYSFSWNGMFSGIISLRLIQIMIQDRFNMFIGWILIILIMPLASFGIYLGRFYRWNSWDILNDPIIMLQDSFNIFMKIYSNSNLFNFLSVMSLSILIAYILVISLASLNIEHYSKEKIDK